ncbi:MAG: DNA/RNA helicase [Candidatus Saganbacteria bacterium]|uniref:DNA/RNA helicase n=1 Tax=Candidatus Saganbacteria bacterium TaxID=2575572 RepID=A0A833NY37_UNCSA|nr:MAG: DNA/RNA helicase [Candidatus Saganbacteria bacterium]
MNKPDTAETILAYREERCPSRSSYGKMFSMELNVICLPDKSFCLEWTKTDKKIEQARERLQNEISRLFAVDPAGAFLRLGLSDHSILLSTSLAYWQGLARLFVHKLSRAPDLENLRERAKVVLTDDEVNQFLAAAPAMPGLENIDRAILCSVFEKMLVRFRQEIAEFKGGAGEFLNRYGQEFQLVGRVYFHLVENKNEQYPFAFLATYSTGLTKAGTSKHLPLKNALQEYANQNDKLLALLSTVYAAARGSRFIAQLIETGEIFHPLSWTAAEAHTFLREIPAYENAGILCRIPNWWKSAASKPRISITAGQTIPSRVGLDALLSFDAKLLLGGEAFSPEEARELLRQTEGLAFIKNKWIEVDHEKLQQTLQAFEQAKNLIEQGGLTLRDALRWQMKPEDILKNQSAGVSLEVTSGDWLRGVTQKLLNLDDPKGTAKPEQSFNGQLRPYQKKGLAWLHYLHQLGLGACLADDMGLGKTIQLLAFLDKLRNVKKRQPSLLIIPASLIGNWSAEIERFTPELKFLVLHPSTEAGGRWDSFDLVITTYSMVARYAALKERHWHYIILDEAQAIKNPLAKQSRAIKELKSFNRLVMTGTPVENRLADLWSLFDFLNPGLLGSAGEFAGFQKSLKDTPAGYARLRQIISPFILRRMKTDKNIITDLPEKVEMKTFTELSRKQAILYQQLVADLKRLVEQAEGIQRKGVILASLMKFKQLCNHPDQYLGSQEFAPADSGKFARLKEICETIYEKRERALIFTQFKEMTRPLQLFLQTIFGHEGLVLHGSVPVKQRKGIIEKFQAAQYLPFMVLSLKAGGVGLNLTAANHVIHFDRWWNPAVENQATDRAFRIGQKKNVIVHKFLTRGTIEEKIDKMLEDKAKLSAEVIASGGESWLTEMKNNELLDLFKLSL